MKNLVSFIISCVMLNGIAAELTPREQELVRFYDEVMAFYNTLNSLKGSPSEESVLKFLSDTQRKEWWSMNAGLGPLDTESNQIEVLRALSGFLLNERGEYNGSIQQSNSPTIKTYNGG